MLEKDPDLLDVLRSEFGSTRDINLVGLKGDLPKKYKFISVDGIVKLPEYKTMMQPKNDEEDDREYNRCLENGGGTIRFGIYRSKNMQDIKIAMFPQKLEWDEERNEFWMPISDAIEKEPIVKQAYQSLISDTAKYYQTLGLSTDAAKKSAKIAIRTLLVDYCE